MRNDVQRAPARGYRPEKADLFPRNGNGPGRRDWLAADAVSIGPVSAANSLVSGKFAGKFTKSSTFGQFNRSIMKSIQWVTAEFPAQSNREILSSLQGISSGEQGFKVLRRGADVPGHPARNSIPTRPELLAVDGRRLMSIRKTPDLARVASLVIR